MEFAGLFFAWEPSKAESNFRKHGVTFEEAMTVFVDPLSLTGPDLDHSDGEARFLITGRSKHRNTLIVSHVDRGDVIRIISARRATRIEVRDYENG